MEQRLAALGHACEDHSFADFIGRIRAGDQQAAVELIRQFEPVIRREVRLRLHDPRLYRLFDSMDISQSVLASFFMRAATGQYDLSRPEHLLKLLVGMTRKKLAFQARKHYRQRRDSRRTVTGGQEQLATVAADGPGPIQLAAGRELLQQVRERLSKEERQLADLRGQGYQWAEIAARVGGTSHARRTQLARAADRVARQLGLDGESND
jgi:DNA-directed RNA polymerase specialized sigma24 family protein